MIIVGNPPYIECSSKGDRRFSAFYAHVLGKSIEAHYQAAKVFFDGSIGLNWRQAKGRQAVNSAFVSALYHELWRIYLLEHPELIDVLKAASGLTDIFGQPGHNCQAITLWALRAEFCGSVTPITLKDIPY